MNIFTFDVEFYLMEFSFETIINTVFYLGAIQGAILTVFLFSVKSNRLSNRLLGVLTSLWAILLLVFALQSYGLYVHYPHLLKSFYLTLFAWFPLLYLSVKYLISNYNSFQKADLIHFIPLGLIFLVNLGFYFKSGAEKIQIVRSEEGYYHIIDIISEEVLSIQGVVYTILCLVIISKYKQNIVDYQSSVNTKVLNGFRNGIILALIAWVIGIVATQLERLDIDIGVDLFLFVYLTFVVIIYLLSILAIRSPEVFKLTEGEVKHFNAKKEFLSGSKDEKVLSRQAIKSVSANDDIDEYQKEDIELNKKLTEFMVNKKPYLNPELSLQEMCEYLEVTRHQLSAVINRYQEKNFYEFVNIYRVNEVKNLMEHSENKEKNNYDLAFDAGFNSKASFYRIFKQFTNQTPSSFRASLGD